MILRPHAYLFDHTSSWHKHFLPLLVDPLESINEEFSDIVVHVDGISHRHPHPQHTIVRLVVFLVHLTCFWPAPTLANKLKTETLIA